MATLTPYKGLDVVEGATGAGGEALTDNFKELADRAPYQAGSNPTVNDDSGDGYAVNDLWLNTSTGVMWICTSASVGAAVWKSFYSRTSTVLNLIPSESSEQVTVGGKLVVSGTGNSSVAGNLSVGTTSSSGTLHVQNNAATDVLYVARQGVRYFSLDFAGSTGNFESDAVLYWQCLNGMFLITQDRTDTTAKAARLGMPHYTNAEEPFLFGLMQSNTTGNILQLGGGSSLGNAATMIDLYTAANNTTTTGSLRLRIDGSGNVGIGTGTGSITALVDINSNVIRLRTAKTPASATAAGNAGDICWDGDYVYVCVATNTWKRSALATW